MPGLGWPSGGNVPRSVARRQPYQAPVLGLGGRQPWGLFRATSTAGWRGLRRQSLGSAGSGGGFPLLGLFSAPFCSLVSYHLSVWSQPGSHLPAGRGCGPGVPPQLAVLSPHPRLGFWDEAHGTRTAGGCQVGTASSCKICLEQTADSRAAQAQGCSGPSVSTGEPRVPWGEGDGEGASWHQRLGAVPDPATAGDIPASRRGKGEKWLCIACTELLKPQWLLSLLLSFFFQPHKSGRQSHPETSSQVHSHNWKKRRESVVLSPPLNCIQNPFSFFLFFFPFLSVSYCPSPGLGLVRRGRAGRCRHVLLAAPAGLGLG